MDHEPKSLWAMLLATILVVAVAVVGTLALGARSYIADTLRPRCAPCLSHLPEAIFEEYALHSPPLPDEPTPDPQQADGGEGETLGEGEGP